MQRVKYAKPILTYNFLLGFKNKMVNKYKVLVYTKDL